MSMNLHCNLLNLWQTPSQITYMCMVQSDGVVKSELSGTKARHALHIYSQWVKYLSNGSWNSTEELNEYIEQINQHLHKVEAIINKKELKVYIL